MNTANPPEATSQHDESRNCPGRDTIFQRDCFMSGPEIEEHREGEEEADDQDRPLRRPPDPTRWAEPPNSSRRPSVRGRGRARADPSRARRGEADRLPRSRAPGGACEQIPARPYGGAVMPFIRVVAADEVAHSARASPTHASHDDRRPVDSVERTRLSRAATQPPAGLSLSATRSISPPIASRRRQREGAEQDEEERRGS